VDAFYGDLQALFGISLEVREGEILALVGANAAGKTTSLRTMSGLMTAAPRVTFAGEDLAAVARTGGWISASSRCRRAGGSSPS
jgi:branched-chain amino acid transport system ATP-binding protein